MKSIIKVVGYVIWIGCGLILLAIYLWWMWLWWNTFGIVIGLVVAPLVYLFPIIWWIKEGVFPLWYFIFWFVSIVGIILIRVASKSEEG